MLFMYSCSDNLLASIRSLLLPSLSSAFFRGLQTSTPDTRGFSKSHNQAAQVPSSKVTRKTRGRFPGPPGGRAGWGHSRVAHSPERAYTLLARHCGSLAKKALARRQCGTLPADRLVDSSVTPMRSTKAIPAKPARHRLQASAL